MTDITLLGPQSPAPNARVALDALGVRGRVCVITAGWQEREGEIEDLCAHLERPVHDLALYARCEAAFAEDPRLFDAHRERQDALIALQRLYRVRLSYALAAAHELAHVEDPAAPLDAHRRAANTALRSLDRFHLRQINRVHADFQARCPLTSSAALGRQREAVRAELASSDAVLIAGGHVAVLLGRMRLLDVAGLLAGKSLIAWSAGAMALAERVVLFHDHPPQGPGDPEVLDAGLGLVRGILPLPDARHRLALADTGRVAIFARRFAPARALTLDSGSLLGFAGGAMVRASEVSRLTPTGRVVDMVPR